MDVATHTSASPLARRELLAGAAFTLTVGAALWLVLGPGPVNYDTAYSLVWGDQIAGGHRPDYSGYMPPTPHPMSTLLGLLLSPLGRGALAAVSLLLILATALAGWLSLQIGRAWRGLPTGLLAATLVLSSEVLLFYGGLAYLDVVFLDLLLLALLVESRRPNAGWPVLALLALAGLWRPEAWLLTGAYAIYLAVVRPAGARRPFWLAAATAVAPLTWLGFDLVTTGDPLRSLLFTRDAAVTLGRATGPSGVLELPSYMHQVLRPAVALAGLLGVLLALAEPRRAPRVAVALLTLSMTGTMLSVAAGTPLNERYLMVAAVLIALLAAHGLTAWTGFAGRPRSLAWIARVGAAAAAAVLVVSIPSQARRVQTNLDMLSRLSFTEHDLIDLVADRRGLCAPVRSPGNRLVPRLALETGRQPADFRTIGPRGRWTGPGTTISPRSRAASETYLGGSFRSVSPRGATTVAQTYEWRVATRCAGQAPPTAATASRAGGSRQASRPASAPSRR